MHDDTTKGTDASSNSEDALPIASLLRMAADGELNDEQQARLDTHLRNTPTDADRVGFERSLKDACTRSLNAEAITCPDSVRAAVMQAIAGEAPAEQPDQQEEAVIGRVDEAGAAHRGNRFSWVRAVGNVAASVAIVALAITLVRMAISPGASSEVIAGFVVKEHQHCVGNESHAVRKLSMTDLQALPKELQGMLGEELWIPELADAGYVFTGAGKCAVPGGPSAHMVFEPASGADAAIFGGTVSLFVQRLDASIFEIEAGRTYTFDQHDPEHRTLIWETNGLVYYLVADTEAQRNEAAARMCDRESWPDPID